MAIRKNGESIPPVPQIPEIAYQNEASNTVFHNEASNPGHSPKNEEQTPDFIEPELLEDCESIPKGSKRAKKVLISISEELKEHYDVVIDTRDKVLNDADETGGAKASVLNATTSILKDLAKIQLELYNSDTIAQIRQAIFNALEEASPAFKKRVLDLLQTHLEQVDA